MYNFIIGGMFFYFLLPILESLMGLICAFIDQFRAKCSVKIAEYQSLREKVALGEEPVRSNPIGFHIPSEEEEEKYQEEEE